MSNELVINSSDEQTRIALLKNKQLIELHTESSKSEYNVGDLYLGTVKRVVPGLNAGFVDIGYEKDAFLHYQDLGENIKSLVKYTKSVLNKKNNEPRLDNFIFEPKIDKHGKASQVLIKNQKILVQVTKEPISTKGPRLSCDISLAGRYIVLVPFSNSISVSRKILDEKERKRLKRLMESIKPANFGVIIRTVAENKEVSELDKDLKSLVEKWATLRKNLKTAESRDKVLGEDARSETFVRDMLNESFDSITVDDKDLYESLKTYTADIAPDMSKIVKLHNGKAKLFEAKGVEKQLKALFGASVSLPQGGYLIIEHTEALHVVDVNSGNKSNNEESQETTALSTNIEAVREVARQLRLRDMGGIIVIDCIDMKIAENRKRIFDIMKEELSKDKAKSVVLPLSKFGLLQITRQRVRPEQNIKTAEVCPSCAGTGKIAASIAVADVIQNNIEFLLNKQNEQGLRVYLHPFIYAYYTKGGLRSIRWQWFWKYKKWVQLVEDSSLGMTKYIFKDKNGEEIETF